MDYSKLPVAKRTRSSNDRRLIEQYYAKRAKSEAVVVSPVEYVVLDSNEDSIANKKGKNSEKIPREKMKEKCKASINDDDGVVEVVNIDDGDESVGGKDVDLDVDEESSGFKEGASLDSRRCEERTNVDDHVVGMDLKKYCNASNDNDVVDEVVNYNYGNESLSNKDAGLDVTVISDSEEEGEDYGRLVNDGGDVEEDIVVDVELPDFSNKESSENETFREESDHDERLDEQSSYDKSVVKGADDCDDDDKLANLLQSSSELAERQPIIGAAVENGTESVKKDGEERRKNMRVATKRQTNKNQLNHLKILVNSLDDEGEGLENFVASDEIAHSGEKLKYKFWYPEKVQVEKSEFDKELDELFAACNMYLASEDIGSPSLEIGNGDHSKIQTDCATRCSQGNHQLVLEEQIGIICKYCSIVHVEIKHILPSFRKPSQQRRRNGYIVQSKSPSPLLSDYFQDTGAEKNGFEDYNTTGTVWDLVPGIKRSMYEHQHEGFEFIWKNLAGGTIIEELEKPLSSSGSGCIISHAPGTGKTRLTIVFLQSFMKLYPDSKPVIIAPKSMLLTWEEEFRKWNVDIPFHNINSLEFSGQENPAAMCISKKIRGSKKNESVARVVKMLSWKMGKSILGITYALFDKLVKGQTRNADCSPTVEQMGKALLKLPTVLILDEGHTPRNDQSFIYNSLLDVETKRRIILSGTPFQNNFTELYNTLRLVNPKFNNAMKTNLRKISKELKSKWSSQKLEELKGMISPFVHVHKGKILQTKCPGLKDALIHLQLTDLQQELITLLSTNEVRTGYLDLSHIISLVSVHPSLLPDRCFHENQFSTYRDRLESLKSDPYSGAKTKFVLELCRLSEALNEKVLIYSQYIDPLMFIKEQLRTQFRWTEGREVLYMDGSLEAKQRQSSISALNDPESQVRVLLASIKACSEGIHLVGASRVVLLDVVWNPSVERQAISRAYRIGQNNVVYTYHLIAEEMEIQKYKVQTAKDRLSEMVFSSKEMDSCTENMPNIASEDKILHEMFQRNEQLGGMFKQIIYQPKESNMVDTFDLIAEE